MLRRQLGSETGSLSASLRLCRRYAGSLPTGSSPPEWQLLCRGIRALASEAPMQKECNEEIGGDLVPAVQEPGMAAELCAERVCKLADSWPAAGRGYKNSSLVQLPWTKDSEERCRDLISSLLDAMSRPP